MRDVGMGHCGTESWGASRACTKMHPTANDQSSILLDFLAGELLLHRYSRILISGGTDFSVGMAGLPGDSTRIAWS